MSIKKLDTRIHSKASERYVDVVFNYPTLVLHTSVPIQYRRTGTEILDEDIDEYLLKVYEEINPSLHIPWKNEQNKFWQQKNKASVTKQFFDVLISDFNWKCTNCHLPENPNYARRIQDLKEFGYTIATHTSKYCNECAKSCSHLILLPLKRGGITGYETWSTELKDKIIRTLQAIDCYEDKKVRKETLLPDHKFPEIRWDEETRRESIEHLNSEEIKRDFQLITNQRNQQKREICRNCYQTGKRGIIFGIPYFYQGDKCWDENVPKRGKGAESGCVGCGWYDISAWRRSLVSKLQSS